MNELRELIESYYPLSDDAFKVVTQSLKTIGSNKIIDYHSVDIEKVPVFLAKLLHKLEEEGATINFLEKTDQTSTYRNSYYFGEVIDNPYISEEEIMSAVIDDIVQAHKGKTIDLFSIAVAVEKDTYKFLTYLRGNIHE